MKASLIDPGDARATVMSISVRGSTTIEAREGKD